MKLVVENLHIDPEGLKIKKDYEALVNIQGTLFIYDGENIFLKNQCLLLWSLRTN